MKLLLFDVDLTLVNSGGAGRTAMTLAFEQVFGKKDGLSHVSFAGRTDRAIFRDGLQEHGIAWTEKRQDQFKQTYINLLQVEIKKPNPKQHIEPGICELLEALTKQPDVILGLLTGNWQSGAKIKLEHFGLLDYFKLGAFADDSEVRNDLPHFAVQRYERQTGGKITPECVYIIGDTPRDVACARSYGAQAVAVATGFYSFEELEASAPDILFRDLSHTTDFLKMLNGKI